MEASNLIRGSRLKAGLTQAELARRLGTTQSAIARLEQEGSNPTVETLERALLASGHELTLRSSKRKSSVDETLIVRLLRMTPAQRLKAFEATYRDLARLGDAVG